MTIDIREREALTEKEVKSLNFIGASPACNFRKHYRQGLRSHIFEVLSADDVVKEREGTLINGTRWFPRATPRYMLRILRTRFTTLEQALDEVKTYTLILKFLGPDLIARSQEFIVDYKIEEGKGSEILLCGLQEFIHGAILDPWTLLGQEPLLTFYRTRFSGCDSRDTVSSQVKKALKSIAYFVRQARQMIIEAGYVPDLAGNGNLILTPDGGIKLVDINNIIRVHMDDNILLDDKNYPSCDKSVEVLAILEQNILENQTTPDDPIYGHFLSPWRKERVKKLEEKFYQSFGSP